MLRFFKIVLRIGGGNKIIRMALNFWGEKTKRNSKKNQLYASNDLNWNSILLLYLKFMILNNTFLYFKKWSSKITPDKKETLRTENEIFKEKIQMRLDRGEICWSKKRNDNKTNLIQFIYKNKKFWLGRLGKKSERLLLKFKNWFIQS